MKPKSTLFESNYERGREYLWVPAATLAMFHIGADLIRKTGGKPTLIPCFLDKPKDGHDYHRCKITIVRTKKECAALKAKWAKKRKVMLKSKCAKN